ncbi:telomerase Cajal body protein 1 [Panulirus ornatus]|uniref:telomerase Cajal body protein 1 n=1 Tax=Panulirus ornatus TaxID=150431 RepID=UPI003A8B77DF
MDEEPVIEEKELLDNIEIMQLQKHISQSLAQFDALMLPENACDEIYARKETVVKDHLEMRFDFNPDIDIHHGNELTDLAQSSDDESRSGLEKCQKPTESHSSLNTLNTNHPECTLSKLDNGVCEANDRVSDFKASVTMKDDNRYLPSASFKFDCPILALNYEEEFKTPQGNFTKGCKWSPDGSCLLVGSEDCKLRLLSLPTAVVNGEFQRESWFMEECKTYSKAAVTIHERELIYDYAWYPFMHSDDHRTCCFAVTCRDHPVHLWDSWTGQLICSYPSYDHLDQLVAAYSVSLNLDGSKIFCGFNKCIRVFQTNRPGRYFDKIDTKGHPGIISCMAFNPQLPTVFAAGSYLGSLGLYNSQNNNLFCRMEGCLGGVTHIQFSADGTKLFSGTRKNNEILCWDMRNIGKILCGYRREVSTNQRIYFDLEPQLCRYLISGSTKGQVLKWDLEPGSEIILEDDDVPIMLPSASFNAHKDCINGISVHPYYPVIATSSGQRHFPEPESESDSDNNSESEVERPLFTRKKIVQENTVKLWWLGGL